MMEVRIVEGEETNLVKEQQKINASGMSEIIKIEDVRRPRKIMKRKVGRCKRKKRALSLVRRKGASNKQIEDYINSKMCELCLGKQNDQQLLLCDRCDDSYHRYCLEKSIQISQDQWICPVCVIQLAETQQQAKSIIIPKIEKKQCYDCKTSLKKPITIVAKDMFNKLIEIEVNELQNQTCAYCKNSFHQSCFSLRMNSLNCSHCQRQIRRQGPHSHEEFMNLLLSSINIIKSPQSEYTILTDLQNDDKASRYRYFRLKVPPYISSWQFIVQYEASLYYAFKTKGLSFIDQQIYNKKDEHLMEVNDPNRDINGHIYRLHEKDEKTYEEFKINSQKGFVGPFEIKQDRVKKFYLVATDYIQPYTIVSQYVGQVITSRNALKYEDNDSIFMLVRSSRSSESLDIVPQKFGNISRFFSGINNNLKRSLRQYENIKSMRFNYKGRVRLLLYTIKPIQAGQTLYFDYNGSPYNEYPTQNFVY